MKFLFPIILIVTSNLAFFAKAQEALNLTTILAKSRAAIKSRKAVNVINVLRNYYFTDKKENSIWFYAQKEAKEMFNVPLSKEDLVSIESGIRKLSNSLEECVHYSRNKRRALCFRNLIDRLEEKQRNALWNYAPDIDREEKGKWGTLFLATLSMNTLISATITANMKYASSPKTYLWKKNLFDFFEHWYSLLYGYEVDVTRWRIDQISAVDICEEKQHFWKSFTLACETRWKRNIDDEVNDNVKNPIKDRLQIKELVNKDRKASREKRSVENATFEMISDDFKKAEQKMKLLIDEEDNGRDHPDNEPALSVSNMIGGPNSFDKIYKGKVVDSVKKVTLFEKEILVQPRDRRGDILLNLVKDGMSKRGVYEKKIRSELEDYNNGTSIILRETMAIHMNDLKDGFKQYF